MKTDMLVSGDGGRTFGPAPVSVPSSSVIDFAFHPLDSGVVYAATRDGLFRASQASSELLFRGIWPPDPTYATWVAAHPTDPDVLLIGESSGGAVFRSEDGGHNWRYVGIGGGHPYRTRSTRALFEPLGSGRVIVSALEQRGGYWLHRSSDDGGSWTTVPGDGGFPTYASDPVRRDVAYLSQLRSGGTTHHVSQDFGLTWEPLAPANPEALGPILCLPSGEVLAVGSGGLYRTDGKGGGWVRTTAGLPGGNPATLVSLGTEGSEFLLVTSAGLFRTERAAEIPVRTAMLPSVVDAYGLNGARFATSLTLFNASDGMAEGTVEYVASAAAGSGGSGSFPIRLRAREQVVIADTSKWLRDAGLEVPPTMPGLPQVGTLKFRTRDGLWGGEVTAISRVTTPSGAGNAGTSLWSLRAEDLHLSPAWLPGLRQTASERTNVAVANGGTGDTIALRTCFRSESRTSCRVAVLGPGEWAQWDSPLAPEGMENADAVIERIAGDAPFAAYATIVDAKTNDGSVLLARAAPAATPTVLPVAVEAGGFETEVVLFNPSGRDATASLIFVDSLDGPPNGIEPRPPFEVTVPAGRSVTIPGVLDTMRSSGIQIGSRAVSHAGLVRVEATTAGVPAALLVSARATIAAPDGGVYAVSYPAITAAEFAHEEAWLSGLAPTASVRSNIAFLNPGTERIELVWEAIPGSATIGLPIRSGAISLLPGEWSQVALGSGNFSGGLVVRIRRVSGVGPFAAYGIVNDGPSPGVGTGDGTYVPMCGVR